MTDIDVAFEMDVDTDVVDDVGLLVVGCGCKRRISSIATRIKLVKIMRGDVNRYLLLLLPLKLRGVRRDLTLKHFG